MFEVFKVVKKCSDGLQYWNGKEFVAEGGKEYQLERSAVSVAMQVRKNHDAPIGVANSKNVLTRMVVTKNGTFHAATVRQ